MPNAFLTFLLQVVLLKMSASCVNENSKIIILYKLFYYVSFSVNLANVTTVKCTLPKVLPTLYSVPHFEGSASFLSSVSTVPLWTENTETLLPSRRRWRLYINIICKKRKKTAYVIQYIYGTLATGFWTAVSQV